MTIIRYELLNWQESYKVEIQIMGYINIKIYKTQYKTNLDRKKTIKIIF